MANSYDPSEWTDDPRVQRAKARRAREAARTLEAAGGMGGARSFGSGLTLGLGPQVAGAMGGIEAKLAGRPWREGYGPARDEEREALEAYETLHPVKSGAARFAGAAVPFMLAGPAATGSALTARVAGRLAPAAATAGAEALAAGATREAARQATIRAAPIGARLLARGVGGSVAGAGGAAIMGATVLIALVFSMANLAVDLAYGFLNPKIRYE